MLSCCGQVLKHLNIKQVQEEYKTPPKIMIIITILFLKRFSMLNMLNFTEQRK